MPKLTIDGKEIEVEAGATVFTAAERLGVSIPHFCYHPKLSIAGNCRMCMVQIAGQPKPAISCATQAQEGMVVDTTGAEIREVRRRVLEFILINHPIDCPICDQAGECKLQEYYMSAGLHESRMPLADKVHKSKRVVFGEHVVYDAERCILCTRCVRFMSEVASSPELDVFGRGDHSYIDVADGGQLKSKYSANINDICPVGALTSRDFRFKCRVWYLKQTPTICPGCSQGCNVDLHHHQSVAYRYLPRENEAVNQCWMCDDGRMTYKSINAESRILLPMVKHTGRLEPVEWDDAIKFLLRELGRLFESDVAMRDIAGVASPHATLEESAYFAKFIRTVLGSEHLVAPPLTWQDGYADEFLIRADKTPNRKSLDLLGIAGTHDEAILTKLVRDTDDGKIKGWFLLDQSWMERFPDREMLTRALKQVALLVIIDSNMAPWTEMGQLVLPKVSFAEMDGVFINEHHRAQRIRMSFPPLGEAKSAWQIVAMIAKAMGKDGNFRATTAEDIVAELVSQERTCSGLSYEKIGLLGQPLA